MLSKTKRGIIISPGGNFTGIRSGAQKGDEGVGEGEVS